jgi:hypothetical protein
MTEVVAAHTLTGMLTVLHTHKQSKRSTVRYDTSCMYIYGTVPVCGSGTQVVPISGAGTYSRVTR